MLVIDYEKLRQTIKPHNNLNFVSQTACDLAKNLITEYGIANDDKLSEWLNEQKYKSHKALMVWVQQQLPLIDSDETDFERYRQLRRLFYANFSEFIEEVH